MRLSDADHEAIAGKVADKLQAADACPHGIDAEAVAGIKEAASDYRVFEAVAKRWLIKAACLGIVGGLATLAVLAVRNKWLAELF